MHSPSTTPQRTLAAAALLFFLLFMVNLAGCILLILLILPAILIVAAPLPVVGPSSGCRPAWPPLFLLLLLQLCILRSLTLPRAAPAGKRGDRRQGSGVAEFLWDSAPAVIMQTRSRAPHVFPPPPMPAGTPARLALRLHPRRLPPPPRLLLLVLLVFILPAIRALLFIGLGSLAFAGLEVVTAVCRLCLICRGGLDGVVHVLVPAAAAGPAQRGKRWKAVSQRQARQAAGGGGGRGPAHLRRCAWRSAILPLELRFMPTASPCGWPAAASGCSSSPGCAAGPGAAVCKRLYFFGAGLEAAAASRVTSTIARCPLHSPPLFEIWRP